MAGNEAVQASPIPVDRMNQIHYLRVLGRTETGEKRLAYTGLKLVCQRYGQSDHPDNQQSLCRLIILENNI